MLTDTLFPYQTLFRSGIGIGEDVTGVEDVQPLVLHRPHVEVADRDDVEAVEVVLAAIGLLVPFHAVLQRRHRMMGAVQITFAHPDARSEEHTSELQSLMRISYAVFSLKKKIKHR